MWREHIIEIKVIPHYGTQHCGEMANLFEKVFGLMLQNNSLIALMISSVSQDCWLRVLPFSKFLWINTPREATDT